MKNKVIKVQGNEITFFANEQEEYISLTDIAKYRNTSEPFAIINNWIRSRSVIEFIGLWEKLHNPNFKPLEFERFKSEAGSNYFVLSPQRWIESTNSIGIISNMESMNSVLIHQNISKQERLVQLNQVAIIQMNSLLSNNNIKKMKAL